MWVCYSVRNKFPHPIVSNVDSGKLILLLTNLYVCESDLGGHSKSAAVILRLYSSHKNQRGQFTTKRLFQVTFRPLAEWTKGE